MRQILYDGNSGLPLHNFPRKPPYRSPWQEMGKALRKLHAGIASALYQLPVYPSVTVHPAGK
jgi:hypothetical protein